MYRKRYGKSYGTIGISSQVDFIGNALRNDHFITEFNDGRGIHHPTLNHG